MHVATIAAYALALFVVYVVAYILYVPLKLVIRLAYSAVVGGIVLWLVNLVGGVFGISVAINPATALAVGLLGLPGLALIIALKYIVLGRI
ncbi:MAG: pro-sigmaK processing inhibitor BofA family protein [Firmicutes bacterium]|jgi:inhibitor of the pro-sigma K processing machinery|nr:pro-sigmaK processing inhibitor BofA family protein [Bacillota bacterium]MDH7496732.1 pro-sigmaK processing inhibitor BofA family protein [Bacillota bacterium]